MKALSYKIILITILIFTTLLNAQTFDKEYKQEFKVNSDVVVNVNTRYTDVEIETWNKNEVIIEATIIIEGASKEKADEIIKNWKFKALGNQDEIEITSKTISFLTHNITHGDNNIFVLSDFDFDFPEVSVGNLSILDSLHVVMPDVLNFSAPVFTAVLEDFHFAFDTPEFDYEKYKNDENYLKEWQEQMKKGLEKMQIKMKKNSAKLKGELKVAQEGRKIALKKYAEHRKEAMKLREEKLKERAKQRKELIKVKREVQEKRREELTKKRVEIKNILIDRDKIKIKRIIKIKAPKNAKFNMNVKYGSMSFPN